MRTLCLAAVTVALVAAGCGGSADVGGPLRSTTTAPLRGVPKPCRSNEVRSLVLRFFEAFAGGDRARLDLVFAPEETFKWYSTNGPGERVNDAAYDRETLVDYFSQRYGLGERLDLRTFKFNGNSDGYGHFEYGLVRSADDLKPTAYYGKGAAICTAGADMIAVWSMGRE